MRASSGGGRPSIFHAESQVSSCGASGNAADGASASTRRRAARSSGSRSATIRWPSPASRRTWRASAWSVRTSIEVAAGTQAPRRRSTRAARSGGGVAVEGHDADPVGLNAARQQDREPGDHRGRLAAAGRRDDLGRPIGQRRRGALLRVERIQDRVERGRFDDLESHRPDDRQSALPAAHRRLTGRGRILSGAAPGPTEDPATPMIHA